MKRSEDIAALAGALAKAQSQFEKVAKSSSGYGYKYASLDELIDKTKKGLAANGLSHLVLMDDGNNNQVKLECTLMHETGQFISSEMLLRPDPTKKMSPMQQLGSAITYGRRYLLQGLLGVAAEEDNDDAPKNEKKNSYQVASNKFMDKNPNLLLAKKEQPKKLSPGMKRIESLLKEMTHDFENYDEYERLCVLIKVENYDSIEKLSDPDKRVVLNILEREYTKFKKERE